MNDNEAAAAAGATLCTGKVFSVDAPVLYSFVDGVSSYRWIALTCLTYLFSFPDKRHTDAVGRHQCRGWHTL